MRVDRRVLALIAGLALSPGALAASQPEPPLLVSADRGTAFGIKGNQGKVTYEGDVVITRGKVVIHGARAIVYLQNQHLDRAVVTGSPATFTWQPENGGLVHGRAATITYFADSDSVLFTGQVHVQRNSETFSAAVANYALKSGTLTAHGGTGAAPGRVHAVIPPSPPGTAPQP